MQVQQLPPLSLLAYQQWQPLLLLLHHLFHRRLRRNPQREENPVLRENSVHLGTMEFSTLTSLIVQNADRHVRTAIINSLSTSPQIFS